MPSIRALTHLAVALLQGCLLAACGGTPPPGPAAFAGAPVVLISIDTLRSDHLPVYGYGGVETPAIDALRDDSILFAHAYAHVPLTLPSHVSILSGLPPTEHGVRDNAGYEVVTERVPWLTRALREHGYATGGFVSAWVLRGDTGLATGFDLYDDRIEWGQQVALGGVSRTGGETVAIARRWLEAHAGGPFFLFVHLYEPHLPYDPPSPFAARYASSPYDGEIAAADELVGELVATLRGLRVYERSIVVLLSDHGEGLGDHGEDEHGILLYREALQVPLLLKLPGGRGAGTTVDAPAQLVDVYPTVAALVGLPRPPSLAGHPLTEIAGQSPRRVYAETYYPRLHLGWSELSSIVDGRHQYIHGPSPELYDLMTDPAERRNLVGHERRIAAALRGDLLALLRPPGSPQNGDEESRSRLAALGYLSGGATPEPGLLPDPRSRLHTLDGLTAAFGHFHAGAHEEAAAAFAGVVRDNPRLLDAWDYYGRTLQALGRFEDALAAYETCLELSRGAPDHALAVAAMQLELGHVERAVATVEAAQAGAARPSPAVLRDLAIRLMEQGRGAEAARILERALAARREPATLAALGLVRSAAGRHHDAVALLVEAREADPDAAATHQHLSLVLLRLGRWEEARASAERALALDPSLPLAWNDLGVALYRSGDPPGALAAWSRAVELDPTQHDTLYNLGTGAAALGRRDEARRALERFVATAPPERYAADLPRARALLRSLG